MFDILVIGSGPAGCSAGIYCARGGRYTGMVLGSNPGGQLMLTHSIENYPGIIDSGYGLMTKMHEQVKHMGVEMISDHVQRVTKNDDVFNVQLTSTVIQARVVIVATGSTAKWLDLADEKHIQQISTCATCDGFAYRGQDVCVIGGGNTAVEDAIYLSRICRTVTLIHRRDTLRAEQIMQDKLFNLPNLRFEWNTEVSEYITAMQQATDDTSAHRTLTAIKLKSGKIIPTSGLFIAIGHHPNSELVAALVDTDAAGYITHVNTSGLFIAGDVMDPRYRQAITAAGLGCSAALDALHYLQ